MDIKLNNYHGFHQVLRSRAIHMLSAVLPLLCAGLSQAQDGGDENEDVAELSGITVFGGADPLSVLPTQPTDSVFGLSRTPLETPRSVTVLSSEMIGTHGVQSIADMTRVAPSTYTTFSFGIQGGIDIRSTSADVYFRGMKRVENRSALPTPIGATDQVEIVRGPPSPIFGSGKIGGYMNYHPKSARAATGRYLQEPTGNISFTTGSHDKRLLAAEFGGPLEVGERPGGFYIYSQFEDSGLYYEDAFNRQEVLQATVDIDLSDSVRLETGTMLQNWKGVGVVGWNRVTQDLIDNGTYITGTPALNLDTDGSGVIELDEIEAVGGLSASVPYEDLGNRAALPDLPPQFALDPATVEEVTIGREEVILERFVESNAEIVFADLIFSPGGSWTITNKMYSEALHQEKAQDLSFSRYQDQLTIEDKVIINQSPIRLSGGTTIENAFSANIRYSDNELRTNSNNQIYSRVDLVRGFQPSTSIANSIEHPQEYPWPDNRVTYSTYTETGIGVLSSIDFESLPVSVIVGARYDRIDARTRTLEDSADERDDGLSYSVSLSFVPLENVRPYITSSEQTVLVMGNGGTLSVGGVRNGAYDTVGLFEYGVKGSLLRDRLAFAVARYDQTRRTLDSDTGEVTATRGIGNELELQYAPTDRFSIVFSGTWQTTEYYPVIAWDNWVTPQVAGYAPEEALGGNISTQLPAIGRYLERPGSPDEVLTFSPTFLLNNGWGISGSVVYQSDFFADVMHTITLPSATVLNISLSLNRGNFSSRLSVYNATDERYFRANAADRAGGVMALPNPGRMADWRFAFRF
jgi:iron complex outermembrane receptor protein